MPNWPRGTSRRAGRYELRVAFGACCRLDHAREMDVALDARRRYDLCFMGPPLRRFFVCFRFVVMRLSRSHRTIRALTFMFCLISSYSSSYAVFILLLFIIVEGERGCRAGPALFWKMARQFFRNASVI